MLGRVLYSEHGREAVRSMLDQIDAREVDLHSASVVMRMMR
jgi:hypothetical protein